MKMKLMKWIAAVSFITLISMFSVPIEVESYTARSELSEYIIGNVYASDILATVNGVPIPSYNIGDKTAIAMEDLRYYGFEVSQGIDFRISATTSTYYWSTVSLMEGDVTISGLPTSRIKASSQMGEIIGSVYAADISLTFMDYRRLPCFVIDSRVCAAIEDLSLYLPLISHQWDGVNRVIELTVHEPVVQTVNLAEIIGRSFDDVGGLLGKMLLTGGTWSFNSNGYGRDYFSGRDFLFDTAITVHTTTVDKIKTFPDYIDVISIEYGQSDEIYSYFVTLDSFSGFEGSRRFHFNGLDYTSTRDDVKKMFSNADFRQTYVRNLTIFGNLDAGSNKRTYNYAEVKVLPPTAEEVLTLRYDSMIYWNDEYAITFDFNSEGRLIKFIVLSNVIK